MVCQCDGEGRTAKIQGGTRWYREFCGGGQGDPFCGRQSGIQRIRDDEGENFRANYFCNGVRPDVLSGEEQGDLCFREQRG